MTNYEQFEKGLKGLFETELTDIFPLSSTEIKCLSYAVHRSMMEIQKYSERIFLNNIESLPEEVLDYLAKEKNLPYYDSEFSLDVKRKLIQEGDTWYFRAGTVDGVESLIQVIFGNGNIVEWFDFDEEDRETYKGYFDVQVNGSLIGEESVEEFIRILKKAKNVSRWLIKVGENCDSQQQLYIVNRMSFSDSIIIDSR